MDVSSAAMKDLASKLLSLEAAKEPDLTADQTLVVCEKLRLSMVRLTGTEGFRVLVVRALGMARLVSPDLQSVCVRNDGALEGLEQVTSDGAISLMSHLLHLLATFIGESLTVRIVAQTWPDLDNLKTDESYE